jgi:hypothetical protein
MGVSRVINRRTAILGLLLVILATAGFGFAASNTVPATSAGDGDEAISGYTVGSVSYQLAADPANLAGVSFELSGGVGLPPAGNVKVKLVQSGGTWFTCNTADTALPADYTCAVTGVTVVAADELRVVAAQ